MRLFELDVDIDKKSRRKNDPDVTGYEEVPVKKTDPTNIDSVVVYLKGKRSAHFTKLARRFDRANRLKKLLSEEEKKLKDQTRNAVDELFDAGDEIYTRVVDTAGLVFKIAKAEERTVEEFDEKGYLKELEQLTGLAVAQLETLKAKYVTSVTSKVAAKVLAPKEKKPTKESIELTEGVFDMIRDYAKRVHNHIKGFLSKWDSKYAAVKAKVESNLA